METTTSTIETLNDLIQINNDRIAGYEKALKEAEDQNLKYLFTNMVGESHQIKLELATEVQALGGEVETGTTGSGKIYRAWMDVKATFTGHDRKTVLSNCEFGEDAAQKAYRSALAEGNELPSYIQDLLLRQQHTLKAAHDDIKSLRDQA